MYEIQYHRRSCGTCRYVREHKTGTISGECLLLGRSLAVGNHPFVRASLRERFCVGWKHRPKTWQIYSEGVNSNPHWHDPYISRETCQRLRKKLFKTPQKSKQDGINK